MRPAFPADYDDPVAAHARPNLLARYRRYEKKALKAQLMHLRNMCADWSDGIAIMDEDRMKSKDFKHDRHSNDYPARSVPPSPTQLWLMRCTVRALYDERAPHMGKAGLLSDPDLSKETVKEMKALGGTAADLRNDLKKGSIKRLGAVDPSHAE